ncbi:MAG: NTP transferase domain-containing protein [Desulfobacterales bacterium]|jgi:bifunctional UDP-N-acetylglucosamine pyrophosphorylase/glucosamine-1-phosphate N-acetyltransferase
MRHKTQLDSEIASIIMAAGRGSRMTGYEGNKTLLPLLPDTSIFEGNHPILLYLLENLPNGRKALIVNHCKEDVIAATRNLDLSYCEQPVLNGTGGAILAARSFIESLPCSKFIITMGDVPFVQKATYMQLVLNLETFDLVILGFCPNDKKQYGVLETQGDIVRKITEWKYWKDYPKEKQADLTICNSGIYAVKKQALKKYLPVMASRPQIVHKEINGKTTAIEEFFITDLIEYMVEDGLSVGYLLAQDESETMGIDDHTALQKAQTIFKVRNTL